MSSEPTEPKGWIGVDLDGTLAYYPYDFPRIGPPIPAMLEKVKGWLAEGKDVRIFTARVAGSGLSSSAGTDNEEWRKDQVELIENWCLEHLGQKLPVTATKDFLMIELHDDRCTQYVTNSGLTIIEWLGSKV